MSLVRTTPPAVSPISLVEVKAIAHLDGQDDDALVASYLRTATDMVEQLTGRALITSTWQYMPVSFLWSCTTSIRVPLAPVQSVDEVSYIDPQGDTQVLDPEVYLVTGLPDGARLGWAPGQSWPTMAHRPEAMTITLTAGYGDSWNDVPEPLRMAVGELVRGLYDGCESAGADALLAPYRMRWV